MFGVNRARLGSDIGKNGMKLRAEIVERFFAHVLDRGGMRRAHLRGRDNLQKRYLLHTAGFNLSLVMRQIIGSGTPKQAASDKNTLFMLFFAADGVLLIFILAEGLGQPAIFPMVIILDALR